MAKDWLKFYCKVINLIANLNVNTVVLFVFCALEIFAFAKTYKLKFY